ncbi:MAG: sulfite exporter TauE/SafE family protein, partial [Thermoanaerobaculia bacterium]|nr:sulfite exporter TauE/SafE family protein [Thermoanaerobaculia bacterium]
MPTAAALVGIFLVASTVRSAAGFGDALIAMPLLTLAVGLQVAAPVFALVAFLTSIAILAGSWRDVHIGEAWPLVIGSALGLPVGLALLSRVPEAPMKIVLGVAIVVFAIVRPKLPALRLRRGGRWAAGLAGAAAGVLGGAYNLNGPPVVIYGALRRWPPQRFRATMQGFFLPSGAMIVAGHALTGLWSREVWIDVAVCLPAMLAGVVVGGWLNRRVQADRFDRWVSILLVAVFAAAPAFAAHHEGAEEEVKSECVMACDQTEQSCTGGCPTLVGLQDQCLMQCADTGDGCR